MTNHSIKREFSVSLVQCPCWAREAPPLAISLLAGNLKSKGFKVHLFDLNNDVFHFLSDKDKELWSLDDLTFWTTEESVKDLIDRYDKQIEACVSRIIEADSQIVGFTVYFTAVTVTMEVARRLKSRSPETLIVLGGPSVLEPAGGMELLKKPFIDALVLREGDETLPELCDMFRSKGRLEKIPGLVYKDGDQIIQGELREPVMSLDNIPYPDYSSFDLSRYGMPNRLCIFSSRSCLNKCHYCSETRYFTRYRVRSGESLFNEIQYHISQHPDVNVFTFNDSIMNGVKKTLRQFSELILENNLKIFWGGQGIISEDMTPELLNLMAKAGCIHIGFGFESGSEAVRNSMNKRNFSNELASRVLKDAHEAGIDTGIHVMFGFPTETEEDFQMSIDFVRNNHKWIKQVHASILFTAFMPDTYMFENPEEFGVDPGMHSVYWETKDGRNTYPVRFDRYERFCKVCVELGFEGFGVQAERADKWKVFGDYYRYKKDFVKAAECYEKDLIKYGYSSDSVSSFMECYKHGEREGKEQNSRGLHDLISHFDNRIRSLEDQL